MQVDSTPRDIVVEIDDGVVGRVEVTALVDIATRSISAAVFRLTTKAVDARLLPARGLTPEFVRPGWAEAAQMAASARPVDAVHRCAPSRGGGRARHHARDHRV